MHLAEINEVIKASPAIQIESPNHAPTTSCVERVALQTHTTIMPNK